MMPSTATRSLRQVPRRAPRRAPRSRARLAALSAGATASAAAFATLAVASARRATVGVDHEIHDAMQERLTGDAADVARDVAPAVDKAGKWWVYVPVAFAAATAVALAPSSGERSRRSRAAGVAAIAAVPGIVAALAPALDDWLPQPPVGVRRRPLDHPVFPSGHAFRIAAIAATTAYVLDREGLAPAAIAWPVAGLVAGTIGIARLVREKHLASDVLGGWAGGLAIAAMALTGYELSRS